MKKASKVWLIVAAALVLGGSILFTCAMAGLNWDFNNLSTESYETKVYEFDEGLGDIYIETDTSDVEIIASRDIGINTVKVVCYENSKEPHSVSLSDGVLTIECADTKTWTDFIGVVNESPKITVYVPQGAWGRYGDLYVKTSTGDIVLPSTLTFDSVEITSSTGDVDNFSSVMGSLEIKNSTGDINMKDMMAFSMKLSASTGNITLENVRCDNELNIRAGTGRTMLEKVSCDAFISKGDTGDIIMRDLDAWLHGVTVERTTGDVEFHSIVHSSVRVYTDTGDVYGSFENDMYFNVESDTGDVNVPDGIFGSNVCYVRTDTGDVKIKIEKPEG